MVETRRPRLLVDRLVPVFLVALVAAAYTPTFGAGFLGYDDDWLIEANPWLDRPLGQALRAFFTDFSSSTRLELGAEYLPVRDLFVYLQVHAFGRSPGAMHAFGIGVYAASSLVLLALLRRLFPDPRVAVLATFLFALHPLHVESVAWLAGQKDLLAMLFVLLALLAHARSGRWLVAVPVFVLLAMLSKSMSVAVLALVVAQDLFLARRPSLPTYAITLAVCAGAMVAHLHVGSIVHMVSAPAGGSRWTAAMTMGPVWLRYLASCVMPTRLSVIYDVPDRTAWSAVSMLGWAFVASSFVVGLWRWRAGSRLPLFAALWFFAPLAPVSQVLVPLQNRMADRYAWLSVLAPALLVATALVAATEACARRRASSVPVMHALTVAIVGALFLATLARASVFADDLLLFAEATERTRASVVAPYQLGMAYDARHRIPEAEAAFELAIVRARPSRDPVGSKASNNLARSLARRGRPDLAVTVLRAAMRDFPEDAKVRRNLARALSRVGRSDEAREVLEGASPPLDASTP